MSQLSDLVQRNMGSAAETPAPQNPTMFPIRQEQPAAPIATVLEPRIALYDKEGQVCAYQAYPPEALEESMCHTSTLGGTLWEK